ncbi:MAG: hypothetical protein MUF25_24500, partial [Pirellulaceae bacterium]|nr:hypothetical protein [Pirellulaceae bacterium]
AHPDLAIPAPPDTPVEIVVSGRTSTLKSIKIVKIGERVPPTFAGTKMNNTPGFTWYLTRHYAMKAQVPKLDEQQILELLIVAELAYPHLVYAIGREPEGLDAKRMPIVYAETREDLNSAVRTDLGDAWRGGGGGVTLYENAAAYNFWTSGGLMYHRRDLLIHENTHMLEMCAVGVGHSTAWFNEGVTHALAQHVYDQQDKRLTVGVLDRGPPNDFFDRGLRDLEEQPVSGEDFYESRVSDPYRPGVYLLFTYFCWSDPDRLMKWRLWRDAMFRAGGRDKVGNNRRLMQAIFGPADQFDREWRAWLAARRNSFHYACWGWEQDADTFQAIGWPPAGFEYSQLDINYGPGEKVSYDPLRMDYPLDGPPPPVVGEVRRAVDEPSLGFLLDFRGESDRGLAGVALARKKGGGTTLQLNDLGKLVLDGTKIGRAKETLPLPAEFSALLRPGHERAGLTVQLSEAKDAFAAILVQGCRELIVDGPAIGLERKTVPLSAELQQAIRQHSNRFGMNLKVAREALQITLRAGEPGKFTEWQTAVPLDAAQRAAIVQGPLALLAKDNWHRITPYLDLARRPEPDLSQPAPLGRWRFAADAELYRLYRAAYELGDDAPASLVQLKANLTAACVQEPVAQQAAVDTYHRQIDQVRRDLRSVADARKRGQALAALLDVSLDLTADANSTTAEPVFVARLQGSRESEVQGTLRIQTQGVRLSGEGVKQEPVRLAAGARQEVRWSVPLAQDDDAGFRAVASAELQCQGEQFTLTSERMARPSIPRWWVIGPLENPGGGAADVVHPIETEPIDLKKTYAGRGGNPVRWRQVQRPAKSNPLAEFVVDLNELYGKPTNVAAYAVAWIEAAQETDAVLGVGSEDGFVAWLNGQRVASVLKAPRTYVSRGDQAPVHLKPGRNELLLKITLTQAGWKFSADLTDSAGRHLEGVR